MFSFLELLICMMNYINYKFVKASGKKEKNKASDLVLRI